MLTDVAMQHKDGFELIKSNQTIDQKVKFVVMSGLLTDQQSSELDKLGIANKIAKPITAELLLNLLAETLPHS